MTLAVNGITFDANDPMKLAKFWAEATGFNIGTPSDGFVRLTSEDSTNKFFFIKVPESKSAKNRVHIDFAVEGDRAAEINRLAALGASEVETHTMDNGFSWTVMQDPEGNEFCVSENH